MQSHQRENEHNKKQTDKEGGTHGPQGHTRSKESLQVMHKRTQKVTTCTSKKRAKQAQQHARK
jgi:hypothetical protein